MLGDIGRARGGELIGVVFGRDVHPFGRGPPLLLGGVETPGAPRLHGHSDGDVVLHAIADAMLGGAGLSDLGRLFPSDDRTPAGVPSTTLLREVVRRIGEAGYRARSVDLTIEGARPRLSDRLDTMRAAGRGAFGVRTKAGGGQGFPGKHPRGRK